MGLADRIPELSLYGSVDPAPPHLIGELAKLREILLDDNFKIFERMRAVFTLRNNRSPEAIAILCEAFQSNSTLLKHELAYVLGQMQNPLAVDKLIEILANSTEHVMVRHEAAEALGAIGNRRAIPILEQYIKDENIVVAESCEVALGLLKLCASKQEISW